MRFSRYLVMRVILLILFALAIGKVATQSYIRQDSAKTTIINAYREHALAACRQHLSRASGSVGATQDRGSQAYRPDHNTSVSVDLIIGNSNLDVRLWQTSHSHWSARYRDPFIVVKTNSASGLSVCQYDINHGTVQARTNEAPPERNS